MIDVVILNTNSGSMLEKCVKNIQRSTTPINLIVADNGSSDGSIDFLEGRRDVSLIRNGKNLGCPEGLNRALLGTRNEYVALLNEDVFPEDDCLEIGVKHMTDDPLIGAVGFNLTNPERGIEQNGTFIDIRTATAGGAASSLTSPFPMPYTGLGSIIVRTKTFKEVGWFEGRFFLYWDDAEFCIRLWKHGYRVLMIPSCRAKHLHQHSIKRNLPSYVPQYYGQRNALLTFLIHTTDQELKRHLPKVMLLRLANIAGAILKRNNDKFISDFFSLFGVLKNLRWTLQRRYDNEKHTKMTLTEISAMSILPNWSDRRIGALFRA